MVDKTNNTDESQPEFEPDIEPSKIEENELAVTAEDYDESLFAIDDDVDLLGQITGIYQIWSNWAYFELEINSPQIPSKDVVEIIQPEMVTETGEVEFVYPIFDYGNILSTSKGSEMYTVGISMCKLYYTIEKMIGILIEKIKDSEGGGEIESEVSFDGHQLAQRKAFESIINLNHNVVVINFDPGEWGEKYLQIIKKLADLGYGYPPEAPRYNYRALGGKGLKASR